MVATLHGLPWDGLASGYAGGCAWALDAGGATCAVAASRGERARDGAWRTHWADRLAVGTLRWRALGTRLDGKLGQACARDNTLLRAVHADAERLIDVSDGH